MLRLRLGLRLGPFVVTSDSRRRRRVRWEARDRLFAVALALAPFAGVALGWWATR